VVVTLCSVLRAITGSEDLGCRVLEGRVDPEIPPLLGVLMRDGVHLGSRDGSWEARPGELLLLYHPSSRPEKIDQ
jgi:hypothetical protein